MESASTSAKVTGAEAVKFDRPFSVPPLVFFTPDVNQTGLITVGTAVNPVTTTGANVRYVPTGSAGTCLLSWVAVGVVL